MRNPKIKRHAFENVSLADKIKKHEAAMNKDWDESKVKRDLSKSTLKKSTSRENVEPWSRKASEISNYSMLSEVAGEPD